MKEVDINNISIEEENPVSLLDILDDVKIYANYVWQKKFIVVAVALLGAIIGVLYAVFRKTNYTAEYKFTIEQSGSSSGMSSMLSMIGLGGGSSSGAFSGDNLVELIKSRSMVEAALLNPVEVDGEKMTLIEYKILADSLRKNCANYEPDPDAKTVSICELSFPVDLPREQYSRAQDSVLMKIAQEMLKKDIEVSKIDKKLSFVSFSVTSKDERFSKLFADALLTTVKDFYIKVKTDRALSNIENFQHRADSIRDELNKSLYRAASYRDLNLNQAKSVVGVEQLKIQTDITINSTVYTEVIKNIEVMKLDLAKESILVQEVDVPKYPLANDKKGKLSSLIKFGFIFAFLAVLALVAKKYFEDMSAEAENKPIATDENE